jgi:hypothetical protein
MGVESVHGINRKNHTKFRFKREFQSDTFGFLDLLSIDVLSSKKKEDLITDATVPLYL